MVKKTPRRRPAGATPGDGRHSTAPPPKIDSDRLVWDPEYRAEIRRLLEVADEAAPPLGRRRILG